MNILFTRPVTGWPHICHSVRAMLRHELIRIVILPTIFSVTTTIFAG